MDKAMSYNALLLKTNRMIEMLRTCGIDVTKFEDARDSIVSETADDVKKSYDYDTLEASGLGQEAFLIQDYGKAESRLNKLYGTLEKYNVYIKAYSLTNLIKEFLSKEDKSPEELKKYNDMLIKLLTELNHSGTLDYQVEGPIIKDIYHAVYLFIKEEYLVFGTSDTMKYLNGNEFLEYEVRRELENLNLKDPRYKEVLIKKSEIDALGFNSSYADGKLIKLIVNASISEELREKAITEIETRLDNYISELEELDREIYHAKNDTFYPRFSMKELAKSLAVLAINLGVTVSVLIGCYKLAHAMTYGNKYLNKTTTYIDTEDNFTEESEYTYNEEDSTTMFEHYQSIGWVSYDLGKVPDEAVEEYMTMDIADFKMSGNLVEERTIDYEFVSKYNEATRIIRQIDVDSDSFEVEDLPVLRIILTAIFAVIPYFIESMIYFVIFEDRYELFCLGDWPVILELQEILEEIINLSSDKLHKIKNKKRINELTKEMIKLIQENEELITKAGGLLEEMTNNPEFNERNAKLKEQLAKEKVIKKKRTK